MKWLAFLSAAVSAVGQAQAPPAAIPTAPGAAQVEEKSLRFGAFLLIV
jgi:hypothetical protein